MTGKATFENPLSLGSESPTASTFEDENDVEAGSLGGILQSTLKKLGSRDATHAHLEFVAGIHRGGHNVNEHFVGSGVLQAGAGLAAVGFEAGKLLTGVGDLALAARVQEMAARTREAGDVGKGLMGEIGMGLGMATQRLDVVRGDSEDDSSFKPHHLEPRANDMAYRILKMFDYHANRALQLEDLRYGIRTLQRFWAEVEEFYPRQDLPHTSIAARLEHSRTHDLLNLILPLATALASNDGGKLSVCDDFVTRCRQLLSEDPDAIRAHRNPDDAEAMNHSRTKQSDITVSKPLTATAKMRARAKAVSMRDLQSVAAAEREEALDHDSTSRFPQLTPTSKSDVNDRASALTRLEVGQRAIGSAARVFTLSLYILAYDSKGVSRSDVDGLDLDTDVDQAWGRVADHREESTKRELEQNKTEGQPAEVFKIAELRQVLLCLVDDESSLSYSLNEIFVNMDADKSGSIAREEFKEWLHSHDQRFEGALDEARKALDEGKNASRYCGDHVLKEEIESHLNLIDHIKEFCSKDSREEVEAGKVFDKFATHDEHEGEHKISGTAGQLDGKGVWHMYQEVLGMHPFDQFTGKPINGMPVFKLGMNRSSTRAQKQLEAKMRYVTQVDILHNLPEDTRYQLARKLKPKEVRKGKIIIKKGAVGKEMYFVKTGKADILIDSEEAKATAFVNAGQFFGEVALLKKTKRNAYVRAATEMDLFVLAEDDLHAIVDSRPELKQVLLDAVERRSKPHEAESEDEKLLEHKRLFIQKVDLLHNLPSEAISELAEYMEATEVVKDEMIVKKGDAGTEMYFVEEGFADVLIEESDAEPVIQIHAGQFFGELALLGGVTGDWRNASIRAATNMNLFTLTKAHLHQVTQAHPSVEQMLREAMERRGIHPHVTLKEFSVWYESPACKLSRIAESIYKYGEKQMSPDVDDVLGSPLSTFKAAVDVINITTGVGNKRRVPDIQGYLCVIVH